MDLISLFFLFVAIEIFESNWQKSDTLHGVILNNYKIYSKSIFLFFILHASFYYTIFVSMYLNNFSFWMSSIFIVKFLDIAFKLSMMKKLSNSMDIKDIMPMNIKMTMIFRYFNVIIYPLTFLFAIEIFL
ncbi:MAG: Uncharacterised protein [Arcobacter lacus]|jgi:hypothetical protein|nr:MAG: Uncharacterised protein [Arcobacter lacus]